MSELTELAQTLRNITGLPDPMFSTPLQEYNGDFLEEEGLCIGDVTNALDILGFTPNKGSGNYLLAKAIMTPSNDAWPKIVFPHMMSVWVQVRFRELGSPFRARVEWLIGAAIERLWGEADKDRVSQLVEPE